MAGHKQITRLCLAGSSRTCFSSQFLLIKPTYEERDSRDEQINSQESTLKITTLQEKLRTRRQLNYSQLSQAGPPTELTAHISVVH
jgi:hypothetical protein